MKEPFTAMGGDTFLLSPFTEGGIFSSQSVRDRKVPSSFVVVAAYVEVPLSCLHIRDTRWCMKGDSWPRYSTHTDTISYIPHTYVSKRRVGYGLTDPILPPKSCLLLLDRVTFLSEDGKTLMPLLPFCSTELLPLYVSPFAGFFLNCFGFNFFQSAIRQWGPLLPAKWNV